MKTEAQKRKCPDTDQGEGAAQTNKQVHHTNPYPPLSMAEKILVCFCAGMALLFTLWLVAIHLGVTRG